MARPTVKHDGFLIPHAGDVANPKMAEPDKVDFSTVGNNRWGVISGCLVTVTGYTASTLGGIVVINGALIPIYASSADLGSGGTQDRFDLIVAATDNSIKVIKGVASTDPVFPDPALDETVLAAVFCPSGSSNFVDNVIDKRNMLADALLTQLDPTKSLIKNRNGTGDWYHVKGDGYTTWEGDTHLYRDPDVDETLHVIRNLLLDGNLGVGDSIAARSLLATEEINGSNLRKGTSLPGTAENGDVFQHATNGTLWVWQNGWEQLAVMNGVMPVGTIIQSVVAPADMPAGWVALNGQPVSIGDYPNLFTIASLTRYRVPGPTGNTMNLPNLSRCVLLTDFANPGVVDTTGAVINLTVNQLPQHNHGVTATGVAGNHGHAVSVAAVGGHTHTLSGGEHTHGVSDPGHAHGAADLMGVHSPVIALFWGGRNKIDALFNDASHTYSVEPLQWTMRATTGIGVSAGGSDHGHAVADGGAHGHTAIASEHTGHSHSVNVQPVGNGADIPINPPHMTVFTYIRS